MPQVINQVLCEFSCRDEASLLSMDLDHHLFNVLLFKRANNGCVYLLTGQEAILVSDIDPIQAGQIHGGKLVFHEGVHAARVHWEERSLLSEWSFVPAH